jgi:hypothetical protein
MKLVACFLKASSSVLSVTSWGLSKSFYEQYGISASLPWFLIHF